MSVSKLVSYIPKFGTSTAAVVKQFTSNPKAENISELPKLSKANSVYKDFKVVFNGTKKEEIAKNYNLILISNSENDNKVIALIE